MKTERRLTHLVTVTLVLVSIAATVVHAHDVLYPGTVLAVEATRLQIKTVDPDTKKAVTLWFTVADATRVKRGDTLVTWAAAKVVRDERVVVVVTHEEGASDSVATEVRLAAR